MIASKKTILFVLLLLIFPGVTFANKYAEKNRDFFRKEFGAVSTESNTAAWEANELFNKLVKASSRVSGKKPELLILPKSAAPFVSWAMTLPDDTVVLVENVLELCFDGEMYPGERGKARLAFILGHELAHVYNNDHQKLGDEQELRFHHTDKAKESWFKGMESKADHDGLLLMTMANYDPGFLLDSSNFFDEYTKKVRARSTFDEHELPVERMKTLKDGLNPLIEKLSIFQEGLQLYKERKYRKAIQKFLVFGRFFQSREVYNNLGLAYYQLALKEESFLAQREIAGFRLATLIDETTLAKKLRPANLGKTRRLSADFQKRMGQAIYYLQLSLKLDSEYIPARINLSSALIATKKYKKATNIATDALDIYPDNSEAKNNMAVSLYLQNPKRNLKNSVQLLREVIKESKDKVFLGATYNLARIQSEQISCSLRSPVHSTRKKCRMRLMKSWQPYLNVDGVSPYAKMAKVELQDNTEKEDASRYHATKRVALIVGNESYANSPLLNPVRDASAMRDKLERMGFDTEVALNLKQGELIEAILAFGSRLTPNTTGLFYYSGHGIQIQGENFLVPIDASRELENGEDGKYDPLKLKRVTVNLNMLLEQMEQAGNKQNIVILDACRNDPIGFDLEKRGLAEVDAPAGVYIAYSTSPGEVAWDGSEGEYSIYSSALLRNISKPGLSLGELFQEVRKQVKDDTQGYQITWDTTTMDEAFYFNPTKEQDWTWHITAGAIALISGWQAKVESERYNDLYDENRTIKDKYQKSTTAVDIVRLQEVYRNNQDKMKTHRNYYQTLDLITVGAALWGAYLLMFETDPEGVYPTADEEWKPEVTFTQEPEKAKFAVSLDWKW